MYTNTHIHIWKVNSYIVYDLFICGLFNNNVNRFDYKLLNAKMINDNEFKRIWKKMVMIWF